MAEYKKMSLSEKGNVLTQTVDNDVDSSELQTQLANFDTDYNSKKLNELYNEFDAITLDDVDSLVTTKIKTSSKVTVKSKIYLTAGILISLLLAFLVVYNIFVIKGLDSGIKVLQDEVAYEEYRVADKMRSLDAISDEALQADLANLGYANVVNAVALPSGESFAKSQMKGESNWFDSLCNFISSIFGG